MKKIITSIITLTILVFFAVGCDEDLTATGSGQLKADKANNSNSFGNLLKITTSKTSQYVEVKFEGNLGANEDDSLHNSISIPIWVKDNSQAYHCTIAETEHDVTKNPMMFSGVFLNNSGDTDSYIGTPTQDVFSANDVSEKVFGCELIDEGGSVKIKSYLNGVLKSTYVIGSNSNPIEDSSVLDPGISNPSLSGKPGIGMNFQWGNLKINAYAVYDKRPQ